VPEQAYPRLETVGRWVKANGDALYGQVDRVRGRMEWLPTGSWTLKGNTGYYWCQRWPGGQLALGGLETPVNRITYLASGEPISFQQSGNRLVMSGLPDASPDAEVGIAVLKFEFDGEPRQRLGAGCVLID
jgi:alpha-L-fucosidase